MNAQIKTNDEVSLAFAAAVGNILYVAWKTIYLVKVLVPLWTRRAGYMLQGLKQDFSIACAVYRGSKIVFVEPSKNETVNNYYRRYEGTEREAE